MKTLSITLFIFILTLSLAYTNENGEGIEVADRSFSMHVLDSVGENQKLAEGTACFEVSYSVYWYNEQTRPGGGYSPVSRSCENNVCLRFKTDESGVFKFGDLFASSKEVRDELRAKCSEHGQYARTLSAKLKSISIDGEGELNEIKALEVPTDYVVTRSAFASPSTITNNIKSVSLLVHHGKLGSDDVTNPVVFTSLIKKIEEFEKVAHWETYLECVNQNSTQRFFTYACTRFLMKLRNDVHDIYIEAGRVIESEVSKVFLGSTPSGQSIDFVTQIAKNFSKKWSPVFMGPMYSKYDTWFNNLGPNYREIVDIQSKEFVEFLDYLKTLRLSLE